MGKDHKEVILNLASRWRHLLDEEAEVLARGDLNKLDRLTKKSLQIQVRLEKILTGINRQSLDREIVDLMKVLLDRNEQLTAELSRGRNELLERIGSLRKSKNSVRGYKQTVHAVPRFITGRT